MNRLTHKFETGYVDSDMLIGKPNVQSVFRYLKSVQCEYGDTFECKITTISNRCHISRNIVPKVLEELADLRLISVGKMTHNKGIAITFNADEYVSLVSALNALSEQERTDFITAFQAHDFKKLEKTYKFKVTPGAGNKLGTIFAKPSSLLDSDNAQNCAVNAQKCATDSLDAQKCALDAQNCAINAQNCAVNAQKCAMAWEFIVECLDTDALISTIIAQKSTPWGEIVSEEDLEQLKMGNIDVLKALGAPKTGNFDAQNCATECTEMCNAMHKSVQLYKNNKEKRIKENAGEALKRMEDDYLEKGASSQKFLENSSEAEDDYELPAYTTQKEFLRKMSRDRNEAKFQEYIRGRHPEKYELLPVREIQEIIQNPENHKQDWEQVIYLLWQTTGDDEGEATLSCESEITAEFLMKVVMNVKDDMEESGQGFTLSLEQIFDMLAFDVAPGKNYTTFQLDFSKIRDLCNPVQDDVERVEDEEENGPGRTPRRSRLEERRRIMAYLDSITETADSRGVDSLTAAEYAILQMIDYVEERRQNRETNPEEVTVYCMGELSKKWAWEADMPDEEIGELFRTLPKRGNRITLHPERIPVDKILQMNEKRKEHSCVEELWEKKQSEEHEED